MYDDALDDRISEWWQTIDHYGNEVRYRPRDPSRPHGCCYVTVRDFFRCGLLLEITYHLGLHAPPGEDWQPMRHPWRTKYRGRLGWWRPATGATTPPRRPLH